MIERADENFCYLTTTGRTSAKPHRIEIWFAAAPDRNTIYLLSGARDRADWVRNLQANPTCTVEIAQRAHEGTARMIEGTDEDEIARTLVHDKYANGDDLKRWRAESLPVAIDF